MIEGAEGEGGEREQQRRFMRRSQTRYVGRGKPLIVPAKEILQGGKDRLSRFSSIPQLRITVSYLNC